MVSCPTSKPETSRSPSTVWLPQWWKTVYLNDEGPSISLRNCNLIHTHRQKRLLQQPSVWWTKTAPETSITWNSCRLWRCCTTTLILRMLNRFWPGLTQSGRDTFHMRFVWMSLCWRVSNVIRTWRGCSFSPQCQHLCSFDGWLHCTQEFCDAIVRASKFPAFHKKFLEEKEKQGKTVERSGSGLKHALRW